MGAIKIFWLREIVAMGPKSDAPDRKDEEATEQELPAKLLDEIVQIISEIEDPKELCECTFSTLETMLQRKDDSALLTSMSVSVGEIIGAIPFDAPAKALKIAVRGAALACADLLLTARDRRAPRPTSEDQSRPEGEAVTAEDAEYYYLPPHLAHLLKRIEYTSPPLPEPKKGFATFRQLYEAAILDRIDNVLIFFQKKRENIVRELPPPFILSTAFSVNLKKAIETLIFPFIGNNKQISILAPGGGWPRIDTQSFWTDPDTKLIRRKILQLWSRGWQDLKMNETPGKTTLKTLKISDNTRALRDLLSPSPPGLYDIPRISNLEIDLIASILELPDDWQEIMTNIWQRCQDLYEQEKDPRVFQQKAREGALRDGILVAIKEFPEQWNDFLVLLCHYVFPRLNTRFLEEFSASLGTTEAAREQRMPYLMRYIRQARAKPAIKLRESKEEEEWRSQAQELSDFLSGRATTDD
jgi:hypothetical protein